MDEDNDSNKLMHFAGGYFDFLHSVVIKKFNQMTPQRISTIPA